MSQTFSWTVGVDTTPPTLVSATPIDIVTLDIIFSEPVVVSEALIPANYAINNGLSVTAALQLSPISYRLTTTAQVPGVHYLITASNIHDLHGNLI